MIYLYVISQQCHKMMKNIETKAMNIAAYADIF